LNQPESPTRWWYTDEGAHITAHRRRIGGPRGEEYLQHGRVWRDQTSLAQSPHDLIIDRCYNIMATTPQRFTWRYAQRGRAAVIDSYISNCTGEGFDTRRLADGTDQGRLRSSTITWKARARTLCSAGLASIQNLIGPTSSSD